MTKIFNRTRKIAFTLAEVLITLTIIGVIAAMVIPNLWQRHFEAEMVSKLKKNVSVLNNAVAQAIAENGAVDEWDIGDSSHSYAGAEKIYNYLKPYIKVRLECGHSNECFSDSYKALFADTSNITVNTDRYYYKFMLEDGTSVAIQNYVGTGCANHSRFFSKDCAGIWVDLNGKKGPNRSGVDMFFLWLTEKNIVPHGVGFRGLVYEKTGNQCTYDNPNPNNGAFCGVHALYKGNMDYLHKSIVDEWKNY